MYAFSSSKRAASTFAGTGKQFLNDASTDTLAGCCSLIFRVGNSSEYAYEFMSANHEKHEACLYAAHVDCNFKLILYVEGRGEKGSWKYAKNFTLAHEIFEAQHIQLMMGRRTY
jgi:hypothetical protein